MDYQVEKVELTEHPTAVVRGVLPEAGVAEFLGSAFGEVMRVPRTLVHLPCRPQ